MVGNCSLAIHSCSVTNNQVSIHKLLGHPFTADQREFTRVCVCAGVIPALTQVDVSKRPTANLSPQPVLATDSELHLGWGHRLLSLHSHLQEI